MIQLMCMGQAHKPAQCTNSVLSFVRMSVLYRQCHQISQQNFRLILISTDKQGSIHCMCSTAGHTHVMAFTSSASYDLPHGVHAPFVKS